MANMGQDIKEAMTGGSVAVVGNNSILQENIVKSQITPSKTSFINCKCNFANYNAKTIDKIYYWTNNTVEIRDEVGFYILPKVYLEKNTTFSITVNRKFFSYLISLDGTLIQRLGETDTWGNVTLTTTEPCYLYLTSPVSITQPMVVNENTLPKYKPYGVYDWDIFNKNILNELSSIDNKFTNEFINVKNGDNLKFICKKENMLDISTKILGSVWGWNGTALATYEDVNACRVGVIRLIKNKTYTFNKIRGVFSLVLSLDNTKLIKKFSETDGMLPVTTYTPTEDCNLYLSYRNVDANNLMVINDSVLPSDYKPYGIYELSLFDRKIDDIRLNEIYVKKDGSGNFVKISDAINSIKDSSKNNVYNIYIYGGVYDIVEELGGTDWIDSVVHSNGERQGLILPDYVNLIGVGNVHIKCEVDDNVATADFARCVSTINIWKNNNLENIKFTSRNTRYTCHDETNNKFSYLKRKVKNCQFIHFGNKDGLWASDKAYAGGTGSGGNYEFVNCIFESKKDASFTFHNNENQESNTFLFDGCKFTCNGHAYGIGFGYYKQNDVNNVNRVFIKNCISDKFIWVNNEGGLTDSTNVFEILNFTNIEVRVV